MPGTEARDWGSLSIEMEIIWQDYDGILKPW